VGTTAGVRSALRRQEPGGEHGAEQRGGNGGELSTVGAGEERLAGAGSERLAGGPGQVPADGDRGSTGLRSRSKPAG
jgi:hypothetical protein